MGRGLNCKGLANREKRQDIFTKLKEDKYDIGLLQDIHWYTKMLNNAMEEWEYKMICAPYTTNSRGTAILFDNSFEFTIGESINDRMGNFSITEIKLHTDFSLVLGSVYAPNQDSPEFIEYLTNSIQSFENFNILIAGDWNSTRKFELDNKNYVTQNNMKMTRAINNMIKTLSLVDPWRLSNPNLRRYTWAQGL